MVKKVKLSSILIILTILISTPVLGIYISSTIGSNAITYNLKIEKTSDKVAANAPKLANGMIPITWNDTESTWEVTSIDNTNNNWYDYFNQKWANIMLSDGAYIAENISEDLTSTDDTQLPDGYDDETNKKIAKIGEKIKEADLGSMFVWIPRYEYKISEKIISVRYITTNTMTPSTGYIIHPAFENGTDTNYENGEWDKELDGFWFAKFETSINDLKTQSLPNKPSKHHINIDDAYTTAKNATFGLTKDEDIQKINSHLVKNSEWGAVSYLSWSSYGTDGQDITINNFFVRPTAADGIAAITGLAGTQIDEDVRTTTTYMYKYETTGGQKASTTGNIYGIYDMKGGLTEYVAAVMEGSISAVAEGSRLVTIYSSSRQNIGDAVVETSGWNNDKAAMPVKNSTQYFMRGEPGNGAGSAGIFAYNGGANAANDFRGFRISLTVE